MTPRFLLVWAMAASLVAMGAVGYIVGKRTATTQQTVQYDRAASEVAGSTEPGAAPAPAPAPEYTVPAQFIDGPREWRSPDAAPLAGYVALFDPVSRELIVEHCRHTGYPVDANGRPGQPLADFCTQVLRGFLQTLTDDGATVRSSNGQTVAVALNASVDDPSPTLVLRFAQHKAILVPGSKNDLLQAFEHEPQIVEQKRRYFMAKNSRPGSDPDGAGDTDDRD